MQESAISYLLKVLVHKVLNFTNSLNTIKNTMVNKCYIGIDPSFRDSGFAVCIIDEDNTVDFKIFKGFLAFLDWLWEAPKNGVYCVENSNLQNITFDMAGSKGVVAKKSRDVGKNMAISQCVVDVLLKMGFETKEVSPKEKGGKKTDKEIQILFKYLKHSAIINYKGLKGEQDKRDAYQLALICKKN